jgi:hypothetical protein
LLAEAHGIYDNERQGQSPVPTCPGELPGSQTESIVAVYSWPEAEGVPMTLSMRY